MFPVAAGVAIDLATLRNLEHKRRQTQEESRRAARHAGHARPGRFFVDETTRTLGTIFFVQSTYRVDSEILADPILGFRGFRGITYDWSISDGKHVLEATL